MPTSQHPHQAQLHGTPTPGDPTPLASMGSSACMHTPTHRHTLAIHAPGKCFRDSSMGVLEVPPLSVCTHEQRRSVRASLVMWVSSPLHLSSLCSGSALADREADSESVGGGRGPFHEESGSRRVHVVHNMSPAFTHQTSAPTRAATYDNICWHPHRAHSSLPSCCHLLSC